MPKRLVFGVGINDADYVVCPSINGKQVKCSFYAKWKGMLGRCYSKKEHEIKPTYKDCTVVEEWKRFSNFKAWMIKQDWKDKELDKDILVPDNKVYGPNTCIFVSKYINSFLLDAASYRGKYPQGVRKSGRYRADISIDNKSKYLGTFNTPEEAEQVYNKAKANEIRRQADMQTDERLIKALYRIADTF